VFHENFAIYLNMFRDLGNSRKLSMDLLETADLSVK